MKPASLERGSEPMHAFPGVGGAPRLNNSSSISRRCSRFFPHLILAIFSDLVLHRVATRRGWPSPFSRQQLTAFVTRRFFICAFCCLCQPASAKQRFSNNIQFDNISQEHQPIRLRPRFVPPSVDCNGVAHDHPRAVVDHQSGMNFCHHRAFLAALLFKAQ